MEEASERIRPRIIPEDRMEPEWVAWIRLSPAERWRASRSLLKHYLSIGGSLEPDPDPQCPFWSREECETFAQRAVAGLPQPRPAE